MSISSVKWCSCTERLSALRQKRSFSAAQGVLELEHQVRLGGAGRADQEQRLLRDGGHHHQVDQVLLLDEESPQRGAEAVEALAQVLGLLLQFLVGPLLADAVVRRGL